MQWCPVCGELLYESCTEYICFECGYERHIDESQDEEKDD